jgi:tRNA 2-thiouridine synthesizing protein A|tara:strand:- start:1302 stop:1529 length:228 start_codon:yes stop_codon:yes gene_type:complete
LEQEQLVDAIGLQCPLPLLKAKQALNTLSSGQLLRVLATDSGSVKDFRTYTDISGHNLLESLQDNDVYSYLIRKK